MEAQRTERVYSRLSGHYDLLFDKVFQAGREESIREMDLKPGERVLEVGVGTGLALPLYPRSVEVVGIDLSDGMLDEARDRINRLGMRHVSVMKMDAASLQFEDGAFDAVLAPYVMSVVTDPQRVLSEMKRVCRPGGRIVIVNHFLSGNPIKASLEKVLTPLSIHIGFRLDTPLSLMLQDKDLTLETSRRVNVFGNWTLLKLKKTTAAK